uniref:PX domain-containing protein n=1 Tax=Petromyzon marinus TaxID=7757 RepID=S4RJ31_PETMA
QIVSRSNAEDVFKLEVCKRYRDIKRLHKALYAIYSTLQLRADDFPPFPKNRLLGRFDPRLIEERRQRAEDLLQFSVTVSTLHQSHEIRVFFQGGVGQTCPPLQRATTRNGLWLPLVPPLGPGPSPGTDQGWYSGHGLEHASRVTRLSGRTATETRESPRLPHDGTGAQTPGCFWLWGHVEELASGDCVLSQIVNSLFHLPLYLLQSAMAFPESSPPGGGSGVSSGTGPLSKAASYLDRVRGSPSRRAGFDTAGGKGAYLLQAAAQIRLALEEEAAERYEGAFNHYQSSVGLLLRGVQADPDPVRREAVRRKTQQYLMRAEHIFTQHLGNGPA